MNSHSSLRAKKITIRFSEVDREPLEIVAANVREAVEKAVVDGTRLHSAILNGADLRGATLFGAMFCMVHLQGALLECTDLRHADLRGARFTGADLSQTDLRNAILEDAYLDKTELSPRWLEGAYLYGAHLENAMHKGAPLWSRRPVLQLGPCGRRGRQTVVFFFENSAEPVVQCGCFYGTLTEFQKKVTETHKGSFYGQEYMAVVNHIKELYNVQLSLKGKDENIRQL